MSWEKKTRRQRCEIQSDDPPTAGDGCGRLWIGAVLVVFLGQGRSAVEVRCQKLA